MIRVEGVLTCTCTTVQDARNAVALFTKQMRATGVQTFASGTWNDLNGLPVVLPDHEPNLVRELGLALVTLASGAVLVRADERSVLEVRGLWMVVPPGQVPS